MDAGSLISQFQLATRAEPAVLDLRGLDAVTRDHSHLDMSGVALISNVLLTSERHRDLVVRIPSGEATLRQLARGALWFALAQRGNTTIEADVPEGAMFASPPSIADLSAWSSRWDPADGEFRSRVWSLGERADNAPFDTVQREFVAFVNPHLAVGRDRLVQELNENVARQWFVRLANEMNPFVSAATEIVTELLYNFSAHPFSTLSSRPPLKRDIPIDRRFGLLILSTTSGGGGDRLHITVFDTGHGIPATLRPKFSKKIRASFADDADLLKRMLNADLPPYGRGEGRGFPRLIDLARRYKGGVEVTTNSDLDIAGTLIGKVSEPEKSATVDLIPHCDVAGTTVHMTLALQRRPGDETARPIDSPFVDLQ